MDDIPLKVLIKAFIADMNPFTKKLIKLFIAIVLLCLSTNTYDVWKIHSKECSIYARNNEKHPCFIFDGLDSEWLW